MEETTSGPRAVDVHQHLWPAELVDRLRARSRVPYLRGWTLHTAGEPPFEIEAADHDATRRVDQDERAGVGAACLSLSAPLGIESLPEAEALPLLDAWHRGLVGLPGHFRGWASVAGPAPDAEGLAGLLRHERFVGLQLPATDLASPDAWERAGDLLRVAELAGAPVLVHPGPVTRSALSGPVPGWWPPVVGYVGQLQAAWWAWQALGGRGSWPHLRIVFGAAAGLAPVHHERHVLRGGDESPVDDGVFVDSSGYGPRALDALVRCLGIDALVLGSDRPYGEPLRELFGAAATHAVRVANPARLLGAQLSLPAQRDPEGPAPWPYAS